MTLPSVSAKRLIKYLLEFSRTCWASPEGNNVGRLALYCRRIPKSMFTSYKLYNDNFFCLLIFVWNLFSSSSSSSGCSCPLILTPMLLVNKSQSLNKGTNRLCSFFHTSSPIYMSKNNRFNIFWKGRLDVSVYLFLKISSISQVKSGNLHQCHCYIYNNCYELVYWVQLLILKDT